MTEKAREMLDKLSVGDVVKFDKLTDMETGIYLGENERFVCILDESGIEAEIRKDEILDIERTELEDISVELFSALIIRRIRKDFSDWQIIYGERVEIENIDDGRIELGFRTKNSWKQDFSYETEDGLVVSSKAYVSGKEILGSIKIEEGNSRFSYGGVTEVMELLTSDMEEIVIESK